MAVRSTLICSKVFLKLDVSELFLNNYNPLILSMHKANMDIQYILDPYACCMYIIDCINKSNKEMTKMLENVLSKSVNKPGPLGGVMRSLTSKYCNLCELSSQEAAYNLLQLRMSGISRTTVFIPTGKEENRCRMLKSKANFEKLNPNSEDIYLAGLLEHCQNRPDDLSKCNLAQFAAYYAYPKKKPKSKKKAIVDNEFQIDDRDSTLDEDDQGDESNSLFELKKIWVVLEKEKDVKSLDFINQIQ